MHITGMSNGKSPSSRGKHVRVKTARGRKRSSTRWLQRQLNDPYVREAKRQGYRSRAAFKLKEMDEKHGLIKKGDVVLDLGAAPGGWSQIAVEKGASKVVAIDLLEIEPIEGVTFLQMDFMNDDAPEALIAAIGEGADVVMSDMAHNTTGHQRTDHLRVMALVETAYDFALEVLNPGGTFIAKVFQGGSGSELTNQMKLDFEKVKHIKPPSSRKNSPEEYVVALGYRGEEDI